MLGTLNPSLNMVNFYLVEKKLIWIPYAFNIFYFCFVSNVEVCYCRRAKIYKHNFHVFITVLSLFLQWYAGSN
jgi:hypothetical protein